MSAIVEVLQQQFRISNSALVYVASYVRDEAHNNRCSYTGTSRFLNWVIGVSGCDGGVCSFTVCLATSVRNAVVVRFISK